MSGIEYFDLPLRCVERQEIDDDGALITRTVEPGGLRVITQHVPTANSVVLGFWVPAGSRDEETQHRGSTHYLEHLLFKGSRTRSAYDIAREFDAVGGDFNAATAKESTHYYCRVLGRDLPMAVDVLTEMLAAPKLARADFELERTVIVDELAMSLDDPQDVAFETFSSLLFGATPLGDPIGGTPETVQATPLEAVREHHRRWYQPRHIVVAAAGRVKHDELVELLHASARKNGWELAGQIDPMQPERVVPQIMPSQVKVVEKDVEQAQLVIGWRGLPVCDPRRDAMSMLLTILSGGMSSRLFQEVREKRGLAYSTYAFDSAYTDCGQFGLYAGCASRNLAEVEKVMLAQLEEVAAGKVTSQDLKLAFSQLCGGVALGMESNRARMERLGRSEVKHHRLRTMSQTFKMLEAVSREEVCALATQLLEQPKVKVCVRAKGE